MTEECGRCRGRSAILAQLTPEQDFKFAQAGKAIPKVMCPRCEGSGLEPQEIDIRTGKPLDERGWPLKE